MRIADRCVSFPCMQTPRKRTTSFRNFRTQVVFTILGVSLSLLMCNNVSAQKRVVVHRPTAELKLDGLLRRLPLSLAHYSIELHPGWLVTETFDSATTLTTLVCTDPSDTLTTFLRSASHPASGVSFNVKDWNSLKGQLRSGYGDHNIGTKVLLDSVMKDVKASFGVHATYELLAKLDDRLEFIAMVITNTETLFVSVDFAPDEYQANIPYYRSIVSGIREQE